MKLLIYLLISNLLVTFSLKAQFDVTSSVTNLASLKALNVNGPYKSVFVRGKTNINDGWQGLFIYSAASTLTADDGMAVQPTSGSGRWVRQFSGNDFPLTWIDPFPLNTHLISLVNFISSNAPGGTIWIPSQSMKINPVTNNISWKNNVNLIWNAGSQFVLNFIPTTNWCFITVTNCNNCYFGNPTIVGVTNTPGSASNYGRGLTILQSTNIIVDNPAITSWYSDPIFMGDDVSTNGNVSVNFYNVPEVIANSNASSEMATYRPYKRVRSFYELVRLDVTREDILAELSSSSDTTYNGWFQYFSDRTDITNAHDVLKPLNGNGRFLRITPYVVGTNGVVVSGFSGNLTPGYIPYASGSNSFGDSPFFRISTNAVGFNGTNFMFQAEDTNSITIYKTIFVGGNSRAQWGTPSSGVVLIAVNDTSSGDPDFNEIYLSTYRDGNHGGFFDLIVNTNQPSLSLKSDNGSSHSGLEVYAGILGGNNYLKFINSNTNLIYVDATLLAGKFLTISSTSNTVALGYNAQVTANNQVMLGNSSQNSFLFNKLSVTNSSLGNVNLYLDNSGEFAYLQGGHTSLSLVASNNVGLIVWAAGMVTPLDNTTDLAGGNAGFQFRDLGLNRHLVWNGTTNTVFDLAGSGSPEAVITAGVGSTYRRYDGGAGTSFYIKESGAGNTGWIGK